MTHLRRHPDAIAFALIGAGIGLYALAAWWAFRLLGEPDETRLQRLALGVDRQRLLERLRREGLGG